MAAKRVWILGTVSWDTVIHVDEFPKVGGFAQGSQRLERLGGSAANIAQGLATAGIETGLVTFLGDDELGDRITKLLQESAIQHLEIVKVADNSSHALVVIDATGERTVFALSNNYLNLLSLKDVDLHADDIVVFALWRPVFLENLKFAQSLGCYTVVGLEALKDLNVTKANLVLGSEAELPLNVDVNQYLDRFEQIVVTAGSRGASLHSAAGVIQQSAHEADVVDTTGAGDSFFSGFLAALARGDLCGKIGMEAGALWSAAMVSQYRSIPPSASDVEGLLQLLKTVEQE